VERLGTGPRHSAARTIELLADLRLLAEDRPDPGDLWARKRLARLPASIASDVEPWLDHLRHGDGRHRPKAPGTWRGYSTAIMPVLLATNRKAFRQLRYLSPPEHGQRDHAGQAWAAARRRAGLGPRPRHAARDHPSGGWRG